jgi:predicted alpha/beta superfamily hydrolase
MSLLTTASKNTPKPKTGSIISIPSFQSAWVQSRQVDIWLPNGFNPESGQKYDVLYMHDGQNMFDRRFGFNRQIWAADVCAQSLIDKGLIRPVIIVGIWNTPQRFEEYLPKPAITGLSPYQQFILKGDRSGISLSDEYLKFIVEELKPYVDIHLPVHTNPWHTFTGGSSMGGLISAYAVASYPHVFGGAACMSTHWPLHLDSYDTSYSMPFMIYLSRHLPVGTAHRMFYDFGTETLDSRYELHQNVMDSVMQSIGYTQGENWITRKFEGHAHNEASWRKRFDVPLRFLFGNIESD